MPPRLRRSIESADFIVAQHAKFELQWLAREGVDIAKLVVFDTMLAEYVRLGNRRGPKDLDSLAKRYALAAKSSVVKRLITGGVCPSQIPERWLVEYGCHDTETTEQVFRLQRRELESLHLLPHLYTRCLLTPVLADIERHGMQLDKERVYEEYNRALAEYETAEAALSKSYEGVNFSSSKQLGVLLYTTLAFAELTKWDGSADRTAGGKPRTDKDAIAALEARTDDQRAFKSLIKELKLAETQLKSLEKMKACCDENDGVLLYKFNQAITQNHRLSSSGQRYKLQGQNFARAFKRLFRARHQDWVVAEGDGMGMEFRIAAHLGRDVVALGDIRGRKDVHRATAAVYNRKREEAVTKDERQAAKSKTFEPLYGATAGDKFKKEYIKYFQTRYSGIFDTQTNWTYQVLKDKQLRTEWGLIFYWPDCRMSSSGRISHSTNIFNYPISCFATGEIIPIGLVHVWHYLRALKLNAFLVNTVHDSVIGETPEYELDTFNAVVNRSLTTDTFRYLDIVYGVRLVVPLGVELKVGRFWSEGEVYEGEFQVDPRELFAEKSDAK